jgi:hypothetical protein
MFTALFAVLAVQASTDGSCPRQPLPPPAEALAAMSGIQSIIFSAKPISEVPAGAWVVRLFRNRYIDDASVEIVRLRRQYSCNRWVIEQRWQASMPAGTFEALGRQLMPHTIPGAGGPAAADPFKATPEASLHGTTIILKLTTPYWQVSRNFDARGRSGTPVSAVFMEIVSKHVPEAERPGPVWKTKSR